MSVTLGDISLLLVTDGSLWGELAVDYAKEAGLDVGHFSWRRGEAPAAAGLSGWRGDWIVGFKADYILSSEELLRADCGALNFHPAPPSLRGVGTYQVALDEERPRYGVTCHHMTEKVDSGKIVATRYFDIPSGASALVLHEMAAAHLYLLYVEVVRLIHARVPLPSSTDEWSGPLHTWQEHETRATRPVLVRTRASTNS